MKMQMKKIIEEGTCSRTGWSGISVGNCIRAIGLPGKSIPGQHDGPDDTVDGHGKPNGWCWSCWRSHQIEHIKAQTSQIEHFKAQISKMKSALQGFKKALVVPEESVDIDSQIAQEADIIVTESGDVVKNRYGNTTSANCPGGGDCYVSFGMPRKSGEDDEIGNPIDKPSKWCWSCWKSHQIDRLRQENQALEAWKKVAVASVTCVSDYLNKRFPSLELDGGILIGNVRTVINHLKTSNGTFKNASQTKSIAEPSVVAALEKLSGDLSYDNVAAAKQILKEIVG